MAAQQDPQTREAAGRKRAAAQLQRNLEDEQRNIDWISQHAGSETEDTA
jgi:ferritin-like metal-binding protein YciE